jgi:hypothetical protein
MQNPNTPKMAKNRVRHIFDTDRLPISLDTRIKQLILFFVFRKMTDTCRIRLNYTPIRQLFFLLFSLMIEMEEMRLVQYVFPLK